MIWDIIPLFCGDYHHDTACCILNIHQYFSLSSSIRRLVTIFYLFNFPECFCILFEIFLCGEFTVSCIVTFYPTIIAGDVVKVSSGFLFCLFCFTSIIPNFPTLGKHKLVADTSILRFPIRFIIRLVIEN